MMVLRCTLSVKFEDSLRTSPNPLAGLFIIGVQKQIFVPVLTFW